MKDAKANKVLLENLLHGYLVELQDRYAEITQQSIDYWMAKMEAADWDLDKVAPYPMDFRMRNEDFISQRNLHDYVESITKAAKEYRSKGDPNIRFSDPERQANVIAKAREDAKRSFDSYVIKLVGKIDAEISSAELEGNLWQGSVLTITTAEGEVQKWNTKMILNQSKYHTVFNQFPTRKMK